MPMLDFRVETFLAVCRHMNFTKAARELNITQPAVSHHMHYLEQAYGTALFQHNGKRLQLTEAGSVAWKAPLPAVMTLCEWSHALRLPTISGLRRAAQANVRICAR